MDTIKNRLNEHVVYLQNEVRKRDDLLESSEFGDSNFELVDYEDDSVVALEDESTVRGGDLVSNRGEDDNAGRLNSG